jgi:dinuclear metal center YbgI/SA1388 family protein
MPPTKTLLTALARLTRPDRAAAWDPVGLQFGDPERAVSRVAVCHEVSGSMTQAILDAAPDLVISYHPLLFRPTTHLVAGRGAEGRAFALISAGIGLAVTHTDFDAAPAGTADALASALGLEGVEPFGPVAGKDQVKVVTFVPEDSVASVVEAMAIAGGGRIGNYDTCSFRVAGEGTFRAGEGADPVTGEAGGFNVEPEVRVEMLAPKARQDGVIAGLVRAHPYEEPAFDVYEVQSNHGFIGRVGELGGTVGELAEEVREKLGDHGLRVAGDLARPTERVAVVPGSGSSFIGAAGAAGADVIVTGDVDHHRAVAALDAGVAVIDPGHANTERPGMRALVGMVRGLGVEVVDLTDAAGGPWSRRLPE